MAAERIVSYWSTLSAIGLPAAGALGGTTGVWHKDDWWAVAIGVTTRLRDLDGVVVNAVIGFVLSVLVFGGYWAAARSVTPLAGPRAPFLRGGHRQRSSAACRASARLPPASQPPSSMPCCAMNARTLSSFSGSPRPSRRPAHGRAATSPG